MIDDNSLLELQRAVQNKANFNLDDYFTICFDFLDEYLLTKLLERNMPVVAIFLHDVQRASFKQDVNQSGDRIFNIDSTFKTNHFLGYTVALNRLDGVYYVDPRPEMLVNDKLRQQIHDFQQFLVKDLWVLSK